MKSTLLKLLLAAVFTSFSILLPQLSNALDADTASVVVSIKQGSLRGISNNGISVWKGIPYAKAPLGDLRFRAPLPPDNWQGVRDATQYGPISMQSRKIMRDPQPQSEDCLFLNIWSPAADGKKRPVMFWIHGGGFIGGSGSSSLYDGEQLAKKGDVVVVSINYRLGPLGFLYFGDMPHANGDFESNLGLRDQIAALKWVKENIAAFGGNPGDVTIFGESAGGISVTTLMTVPEAKGLFSKAIAESSAPGDVWEPAFSTQITQRYLKMLGVAPGDLAKLKLLPVDSLIHAMETLMFQLRSEPTMAKAFAPTIDGSFLPEEPIQAIKEGKAQGVSLMIGTNKNEANLFALKRINTVPRSGKELDLYVTKVKPDDKKRLYGAYKNINGKNGVLQFVTDGIFEMPSIEYAANQSAYAPTYMYRFDWSSLGLKLAGLRACHGLELPFVFGTFNTSLGKKLGILASKKTIYHISEEIQKSWLNFARTGNPNSAGQSVWPIYSVDQRPTFIFNRKVHATGDPNSARRKAWAGLSVFQ